MKNSQTLVLELGETPYNEAFDLQRKIVDARSRGIIEDVFILLEHPPVFTANRDITFKNILVSEDELNKQGVEVCRTDRGGDVTYHGPGQIVGYMIMDLKKQGKDLHRYIRNVEQLLIDTLGDFGINSDRDPKHPGVWVGREKVAAIGIAVKSGWITMHGFALNVNPNMQHYKMIIACGIADKGVTSMKTLLDREISLKDVKARLVFNYGKLFGKELRNISPEEIKCLL